MDEEGALAVDRHGAPKKASSPVLSQNSQDTVNCDENENAEIGVHHHYADSMNPTPFQFQPTLNPTPSMLPKIKSEGHSAAESSSVGGVDAIERQRASQLPPQFSGFSSPPHHLGHPRYLPMVYPPFSAVPALPPPAIGGPFHPPQGMHPRFPPPPPQQYHMVTPLGVRPPRFSGHDLENMATTDSTEDSDDGKPPPLPLPLAAPPPVYQPMIFPPAFIPMASMGGGALSVVPKPPPPGDAPSKIMINEDDIFGHSAPPNSNVVAFPQSLGRTPNPIMILNQRPFGGNRPAFPFPPYNDQKVAFPPPPPFSLPFPSPAPSKRGIKRKRESDGDDAHSDEAALRREPADDGKDGSGDADGDGDGDGDDGDNDGGGERDAATDDDSVSNYSDDMEQDRCDESCDDDDDRKTESTRFVRKARRRPLGKRRKTAVRRRRAKKQHSGGGHICSWCNKAFVQNCHLSRHIREQHVTAGARPSFECMICSKRFNQRSNLKVHLRSHALDEAVSRPWLCTECYPNRRFTRKSSLKRHWIKKHKALSAVLIADLEESISNQGELDERIEDHIIEHPAGYGYPHGTDGVVKREQRDRVKCERLRYDNGIYRIGDIEIPPEVFVPAPPDSGFSALHRVNDDSLPPLLDN